LKHDSYYSYYTALFLHQLTLQIPKTIYLNFEHSVPSDNDSTGAKLTQNAIDNAFKNQQRKSSVLFTFNNKKIIITNGKYTGGLGVMEHVTDNQSYMFTNLERTLIDIAVRPVYAGGVFEVIEAFKIAKGKLDVKKMDTYLNKLDYIYPYHQIIGFYLEKANYDKNDVQIFRKEMKFDFYLTYGIRNKEYSKDWKLYFPKGV
jgi:predicted transcriptional regulator of viral defense system